MTRLWKTRGVARRRQRPPEADGWHDELGFQVWLRILSYFEGRSESFVLVVVSGLTDID